MVHASVTFQPEGRRAVVAGSETLLQAAQRCGVGIEDLCGGQGTCGKCKVVVHHGSDLLTPRTDSELLLHAEDHRRGIRLACQCRPERAGPLILEIPPESQRSWQRLQTAGLTPECRLAPEFVRVRVPANLDLAGLRALGWEVSEGTSVSADRLAVLRGPRWLVAQERRVLRVTSTKEPLWAVAVDLGSTKIAAYLVNLETGKTLTAVSAPNPQMVHGEDLMSRLAFAQRSSENERRLHTELVETVRSLTEKACGRARGSPSYVIAYVAVGNTAMQHFFLGVPVRSLGRAPYTPSTREEEVRTSGELALGGQPSATVIVPPVVGAFVGSDLVAGVRATHVDRARGLRVFVDVGTNTEICAGNRERLVACSAPSGPAFEGAHILFGMRAADGAIERVSLAPQDWTVVYRTIGKGKPRGLCGSALLDLLAELARVGAVDRTGRLPRSRTHDQLVSVQGRTAFRIVPAEETAIGQDIVLTQDDIGQLLLAKAAIRAGTEVLLTELHRGAAEIQELYLAGAFGTYLAPESALRAGLIPPLPIERIRFVGNTAGTGARLAILSRHERNELRELSRAIEHVSLAEDSRFARKFASSLALPGEAMGLPHLESG